MIRGSVIPLRDKPKREIVADINIHNRFDIEVIDAMTGEVKQKAEAYNVVTNTYWKRVIDYSNYTTWFSYIHYGKGTGTPSENDTGLFHFVEAKSATGRVVGGSAEDGYAYCRKQIQLSETTSVGVEITEVGIGFSSSDGSLCTHAMLQDMNGNSISINKTDTDIINIYATVYVHWNPEGYDNGSVYIGFRQQYVDLVNTQQSSLPPYTILSCLLGVAGFGNLAAMFSSGPPTMATEGWSNSNSAPRTSATYVKDSENRRMIINVSRLTVGTKNMPDGIRTCYVGGLYTHGGWEQTVYPDIVIETPSSGLPGTDITDEIVGTGDGIRVDFTTKFPFPSSAKVYVDGIENSEVIVDEDRPGRSTSASFFDYMQKASEYFLHFSLGYDRNVPYSASAGPLFGESPYGNEKTGAGPHQAIFYNRCWQYGIKTLSTEIPNGAYIVIEVSDDLVNWIKLPKSVYTVVEVNGSNVGRHITTVPEEYRYYKYWNFYASEPRTSQYYQNNAILVTPDIDFSTNIHFTTPPAEGSVITIDYYTPVVAKDSEHVFDLTVTIQLGEYTEG